jgi:hypothetical protein
MIGGSPPPSPSSNGDSDGFYEYDYLSCGDQSGVGDAHGDCVEVSAASFLLFSFLLLSFPSFLVPLKPLLFCF